MAKQLKHPIRSAFEAWVFLDNHPKLQVNERIQVTEETAKHKIRNTRIVKDACGFEWREWLTLKRHAVVENLDIHYTLVDGTGKRNKDESKNTHQAVWLECGEMEWGHHSKPEWENCPAYLMHYHDIDLDCGAPTFDEAIVKLAKLVKKKFGDYPAEPWQLMDGKL